MNKDRRSVLTSLGLVLSTVMWGCAAPVGGDDIAAHGEPLVALSGRVLEFTPFLDPELAAGGDREVRRLITSAAQYERLLGHAPPGDVDFGAGEIVVYYSAGVKRTGGYDASIVGITYRRGTLEVTTRLSSPGENCPVTQALTHPHTLVKLPRPWFLYGVQFERDDAVRDCEAPPTCDDVVCPLGRHCELVPVVCITAPCPAPAECVPDEPPVRVCGGFAGVACPGAGECVDDPKDECDPEQGGADCGGLCRCEVLGLCQSGLVWDDSPEVCDCVPDPAQAPCAAVRCRAGTHCEADGGSATCVPDAPFCGGIAGFRCPGAGNCVDDPGDDCDPKNGGADCGGFCQCEALGLCQSGSVWDDSPDVCACVPETNACAAVLCQVGTTCEVIAGEPFCVSNGSQACGDVICAEGNTCCNASCGICTPPGFFCTQQACLQR